MLSYLEETVIAIPVSIAIATPAKISAVSLQELAAISF